MSLDKVGKEDELRNLNSQLVCPTDDLKASMCALKKDPSLLQSQD